VDGLEINSFSRERMRHPKLIVLKIQEDRLSLIRFIH